MKKARALTDRVAEKSVTVPSGCVEWTGQIDRNGYGRIWVSGRGKQFAHRIAYELSFGPIPSGLIVCHKCDNNRCVNPYHLFVGTQSDNLSDMTAKGRRAIGEKLGQSKISINVVEKIRSLRGVHSTAAIAEMFGVSPATVCRVQLGRSWAHVKFDDEYSSQLMKEGETCKNGHGRGGNSSYLSAGGNLVCRLCRRKSDKRRREKNRSLRDG